MSLTSNLKSALFLVLSMLTANKAHAVFTLTAASGLSASSVPDRIIYGGIAGTCSSDSMDGTSTCNSCIGTTAAACNKTNVYPSLTIKLSFKTDKANLSSTSTNVTLRATQSSIGTSLGTLFRPVTVTTSSEFTISLLWSELCPLFGADSTCTSTDIASSGILTGIIEVGLDDSKSGSPDSDNKTAITVKLNRVPESTYDALSATCPVNGSIAVGASGSSNVGICDFQVAAGDGKIYLKDPRKGAYASDGSLTPQFDGFAYTGLVLFYRATTAGNEAADLAAISSGSGSKDFDFKIVNKEVEFNDNRALGFDNGQKYCFVSANKNVAGNIFYFAPSASLATDIANHCVTPSIAVGLLDDKHCFIATATYGSDMAPEVQTFREFRNKYLLSSKWGRTLVRAYYRLSPPVADVIAQSSVLKSISLMILWPILGLVKFTLFIGEAALGGAANSGAFVMLLFLTLLAFAFLMLLSFIVLAFCRPGIRSFSLTALRKTLGKAFSKAFGKTLRKTCQSLQQLLRPSKTTQHLLLILVIGSCLTFGLAALAGQDVELIEHPEAAKGLLRIEKDGSYIYKTKALDTKNSSQFRIGMLPALDMKASYVDGTNKNVDVSFSDLYSDASLPFFMYDYEWQPFRQMGRLGIQIGGGLFFAEGHGRLISTNEESEEKYTFIGLPLSVGGIYRLQLSPRPWMAPYVAGGLTYFAVLEKRDDKSTPNAFGAPGAYAAAGMMFNIASLSRETAYALSSEYGIGNIWLVTEFRYIKTFSDDLNVNTGFFNAGVCVDF